MYAELIALRLIHVMMGVFWAGSIVFMAVFLEPSLRGAGPAGGQVMQQLIGRRVTQVLPVVALLTILSGLRLLAIDSAGFNADWMRSTHGMAFSIGAAAALIGFGVGIFVMRPALNRVIAIGADPAGQAEAQALRMRSARAGRIVAGLLTIAAGAMAIGRYL